MPKTIQLMTDGISYTKKDNDCAFPACPESVDFKKHPVAPAGWATVTIQRRSRKGGNAHQTFLLCPDHTIGFVPRQVSLFQRFKNLVRTVIESPFSGDVALNQRYLRACMAHAFKNGEAPYASHGLYTQEGVLDDTKPAERTLGMEAGFLWGEAAQLITVYTDLGVSSGMALGIERHERAGKLVRYRQLPGWEGPKVVSERIKHT